MTLLVFIFLAIQTLCFWDFVVSQLMLYPRTLLQSRNTAEKGAVPSIH